MAMTIALGSGGNSMKLLIIPLLVAFAALGAGVPASRVAAHPGGLNAEGCHNNRKTGGYHCHRGAVQGTTKPRKMRISGGGAFANCAAARAAGAAPVTRGDPGYGSHLDRDNDGVGCE
jgi:hypothetical protein